MLIHKQVIETEYRLLRKCKISKFVYHPVEIVFHITWTSNFDKAMLADYIF